MRSKYTIVYESMKGKACLCVVIIILTENHFKENVAIFMSIEQLNAAGKACGAD